MPSWLWFSLIQVVSHQLYIVMNEENIIFTFTSSIVEKYV